MAWIVWSGEGYPERRASKIRDCPYLQRGRPSEHHLAAINHTDAASGNSSSNIWSQDGMRMIVSRDLDCTNTLYIQFSFKFITKGQRYTPCFWYCFWSVCLPMFYTVGFSRCSRAFSFRTAAVLGEWWNQLADVGWVLLPHLHWHSVPPPRLASQRSD